MAKTLTNVTVDHDQIRRWAEERGGKPAMVKGTGRDGIGIIRLDFPGYTGEEKLQPITWDEWFDKFEQTDLAFVYQEKTGRGVKSNFNKLVGRETVDVERGETKVRPARRAQKAAGALRAPRAAAARAARGAKAPAKKPAAKRKAPARGKKKR